MGFPNDDLESLESFQKFRAMLFQGWKRVGGLFEIEEFGGKTLGTKLKTEEC